MAMYNTLRSIALPVPEIPDDSKARPYLNTEMFRMLLKLLDIHDLDISDEDRKVLNLERLDRLHKAYYTLWGMVFEDFPRADGKSKVPLLRRCFLWGYLGCWFNMEPDKCHTQINKALSSKDIQFLDPFKDEKWLHPVIPRSFFPPGLGNVSSLTAFTRLQVLEGNWRESRKKLMEQFKKELRKRVREKVFVEFLNMMQQMQNRQMQGMIDRINNMSMMNAANAGLRSQQQFAVAQASAFAKQDAALGMPGTTYTYQYGYGPPGTPGQW